MTDTKDPLRTPASLVDDADDQLQVRSAVNDHARRLDELSRRDNAKAFSSDVKARLEAVENKTGRDLMRSERRIEQHIEKDGAKTGDRLRILSEDVEVNETAIYKLREEVEELKRARELADNRAVADGRKIAYLEGCISVLQRP